jgi:phosphatidylglycerol---prolipoprotein diacylglyceryl transferase
MHPILLKIPIPDFLRDLLHAAGFDIPAYLPVFSYGFMMMLAFLSALCLALWRARRERIPAQAIYDLGLIAILAGVVGARLMWVIQESDPAQMRSLADYFAVWRGGLVYYGGLLLALPACIAYVIRKRLPLGRTADCFAPGLAAGIGFGRIGCFLNGCCYGASCSADAWYLHTFPPGSYAALHYHGSYLGERIASPPVYPSQLVSSVSGFFIFFILLFLFRKRRFGGQILLHFLQLYAVARFLIEFMRDDTQRILAAGGFGGLKPGQWIALLTFVAASALLWRMWTRAPAKAKGGADAAT